MRDGFEFDEDFVKGAAFVEPSHTQRSRKRRRWRRAALTVIAVLVGAGVATGGVLWVTRDVDDTPPVAAPSASKDATRPSAPGDPFAGSPAESYAVGAAGIVVPKATAVGGVPAKQVAGAYARAKRMLVAAGLDRKALLGGAPDAFAGTLDSRKRTSFRKRLKAARSTRHWLVSFAPRSVELYGETIKVHGSMSARPARRSGVRGIDVKVDYLFVYAVQQPGQPATVQRLVARLTGTWFLDPGSGGSFWLMEQGVSATPARCKPNDGFIRPTFPEYGGEDPDTEPSGTPIDPYDQSRPEETGTGCRRASRT